MSARRGAIGILALAAAISCRPDDQRTETLDRASRAREHRTVLEP